VDENWNAYPDQWKILLSKPKLSKDFIEEKLKEWKSFATNQAIEINEIWEQDGEKPWDKNRGNREMLFAEERRRQRFCIYVDRAVWSVKAIIILEKT